MPLEELLSHADLALYSAKSSGGGTRTFFHRAMQNRSEQQHRLGIELRCALEGDQFELLYQPQVTLKDRKLAGAEALLRWRHRNRGFLKPNIFMDVLERSTVAEAVGDWILDQARGAAAHWDRCGLGNIRIGVNLFPAQLRSGRLSSAVSAALARHGLAPDRLELEITENTVLQNSSQAAQQLNKLKALGVKVAFDDFGTGFASLSLLQSFPLTRLKIDRSFVSQIDRNAGDAVIVNAVIRMARSLKLSVIAEGVETAEQEATLIGLECDEVQGYRYGATDVSRRGFPGSSCRPAHRHRIRG